MDLAAGATGSLLHKLFYLIEEESKLEGVVQRQLVFIIGELQMQESVLRVAEVRDEQVKIWARKVREFCYDLEDRIDTFLVNTDSRRPPHPERVGGKSSSSWLKRAMKKPIILGGKAHGDFAAAIEDMVKQIQVLSDRWRDKEFLTKQVAAASVDPRLPALYRNERELVGTDEARGELVKMLAQGDAGDQRKLKIVSILGMGGVGKTTLAKAVYNGLEAEFDCSAFVSVSWNPDMKKVLRDIILELDDAEDYTRLSTMDKKLLINKIQGFLKNKRFLIVIDDIWTTEVWEKIRLVLVDSHCGSRIVATSPKYAVPMQFDGSTYRLKPLSYDSSQKLLCKRIFGGEGNCPNNSQWAEICDKILKKCGGLPLAIITAASVFASKPLEEWSIAAFSYGSNNRYMDNMRMVLSHSYYNLTSYLKTCILHLSMFPENCWIEKDFLIWKWIAEGFVHEEQGMSSFEIGERYFNELVNSSMIQIEEGHVDGCRVHPVVYSLIRSISSEEYFSTVLDDEHHYTSAGGDIARRIAVLRRRNVEHHNMMSMGKVRSFSGSLCFVDSVMPRLSSFQVLRVLALEYCPGLRTNTHLRQIGNLVHLRYLGLVGAGDLGELPEETLGGLRYLQTLDLRETRIAKFPYMPYYLMCLCTGWIERVPEVMVGRLTSYLEDLRIHNVSGGDSAKNLAAKLRGFERLRILEIGFEEMDEELEKALMESLHKLDKIQRLEVYCMSSNRAVMWGKEEEGGWVPPPHIRWLVFGGIFFSEVPRWIHPDRLPRLSNLQLHLDVVEDGHLKTLGSLPQLRSLALLTGRDEEIVVGGVDHGAFKKLKLFRSNVPVKFVTRHGQTPMPNLEDVEFRIRAPAEVEAAGYWFSSLANLPSLAKVTVVVLDDGRILTDAAIQTLRHEAVIIAANRRLEFQVTRKTRKPNEDLFYHLFRFRNPHFEALQLEMEKMMSNGQEAGSSSAPP